MVDRPGLGALLDIGHANMLPGDDPVRAGEVLAPHLVHCHAHYNDGAADTHGPLGTGTVDWPQVALALETSGYEGDLTIEVGSANPDGDAARGRAFLVEHLLSARERR